jgi:hypothetical protein
MKLLKRNGVFTNIASATGGEAAFQLMGWTPTGDVLFCYAALGGAPGFAACTGGTNTVENAAANPPFDNSVANGQVSHIAQADADEDTAAQGYWNHPGNRDITPDPIASGDSVF